MKHTFIVGILISTGFLLGGLNEKDVKKIKELTLQSIYLNERCDFVINASNKVTSSMYYKNMAKNRDVKPDDFLAIHYTWKLFDCVDVLNVYDEVKKNESNNSNNQYEKKIGGLILWIYELLIDTGYLFEEDKGLKFEVLKKQGISNLKTDDMATILKELTSGLKNMVNEFKDRNDYERMGWLYSIAFTQPCGVSSDGRYEYLNLEMIKKNKKTLIEAPEDGIAKKFYEIVVKQYGLLVPITFLSE